MTNQRGCDRVVLTIKETQLRVANCKWDKIPKVIKMNLCKIDVSYRINETDEFTIFVNDITEYNLEHKYEHIGDILIDEVHNIDWSNINHDKTDIHQISVAIYTLWDKNLPQSNGNWCYEQSVEVVFSAPKMTITEI